MDKDEWAFIKKAHLEARGAAKGIRGSKRQTTLLQSLAESAGGSWNYSEWRMGYSFDGNESANVMWLLLLRHCVNIWGDTVTLLKAPSKD